MSTQEFTDVEALRQQCTKIRQLAMEALNGAIQRRDAVLNEVRQEEQRLATIAAERRVAEESLSTIHSEVRVAEESLSTIHGEVRVAEESLSGIHGEVERFMREFEMLGADLTLRTTADVAPLAPAIAADIPLPAPAMAAESVTTAHDEMDRLTSELERLRAELSPPTPAA